MGTVVSVSAPIRKWTWKSVLKRTSDCDYGRPFVEMVKGHPQYGPWIDTETMYEVKLVHHESPHWYLLIKKKDSALLYISVEIRTTNLSD